MELHSSGRSLPSLLLSSSMAATSHATLSLASAWAAVEDHFDESLTSEGGIGEPTPLRVGQVAAVLKKLGFQDKSNRHLVMRGHVVDVPVGRKGLMECLSKCDVVMTEGEVAAVARMKGRGGGTFFTYRQVVVMGVVVGDAGDGGDGGDGGGGGGDRCR